MVPSKIILALQVVDVVDRQANITTDGTSHLKIIPTRDYSDEDKEKLTQAGWTEWKTISQTTPDGSFHFDLSQGISNFPDDEMAESYPIWQYGLYLSSLLPKDARTADYSDDERAIHRLFEAINSLKSVPQDCRLAKDIGALCTRIKQSIDSEGYIQNHDTINQIADRVKAFPRDRLWRLSDADIYNRY